MKNILFFIIVLLNTTLVLSQNQNAKNPNDIVVIVDANIIDVENGNIANKMTVIIKGNRIAEIGKGHQLKIPKRAKVVYANGKFLIPGLCDMHAHTSSESNTRNVIYPLFIANGITTVRVMSGDCFDPCRELVMNINQSRKLQKEISNGELIGPKTTFGSFYINGANPGHSSTVKKPGNAEDGKKLVHLLKERGVDFIKIYDGLSRAAYFGIAKEAQKEHITFLGHNPHLLKASEVSDAGQKSIEHCCEGNLLIECSSKEDELRKKYAELYAADSTKNLYDLVLEMVKSYDKTKCQNIYQTFIKNKTWLVPTLLVEDATNPIRVNWRNDPRLKYIPKNELNSWENVEISFNSFFGTPSAAIKQKRQEMILEMHKAGVNLLAGSDCGVFGVFYGESLHDELALLVEAGLTELEALQAATFKPAQYAQATDSLGNIKKGMIADLLLLDENPLKNIKNTKRINVVVANGRLFDRKALDSILDKASIEAAK